MELKRQPEEFKDCTSRIIGCAMRVHSVLGNGFQEAIYQRALEIEMALEGLGFVREFEMPISIEQSRLEPAGSTSLLKEKSW